MTETSKQTLPAREVAFPSSVSEAARRTLAFWAGLPVSSPPPIDDAEAWRARARQSNAALLSMLGPGIDAVRDRVASERIALGGVPAFRIAPHADTDGRVLFEIHGGGFTSGAGEVCEGMAIPTAAAFGALVYSIDYRMPPEAPHPAALDDCMAAYREVLAAHGPTAVVVRGISAGANLAAAMILRARDEDLPFPAAVVLGTPELDLTESGDSFQTNALLDVVLKGSLMQANLLYADGHDLTDPLLSPLFGDFTRGFPPTLLTAGTRDLFLSNAARMHNALRRTGNYSELIIEEAMPHGGFFGAPEDHALLEDMVSFARRAWSGALPTRP